VDALQLLLNAVTVIFIAATMFAVGLGATLGALRTALGDLRLLALVLLGNLVLVPLLGWGLAALFGLATAPFIALILTAASPGGPFGAKLGMVQGGDVTTGAAMQVVLAAVGSITFGFTANALLRAAGVGGGVSLDVGTLVRTVVLLQLVPFAVGLLLRHGAAATARSWHPAAAAVSNVTFLMVLAGMLLGSWSDVVALLGTRSLLAGFLFSALSFGLGALLATGPSRRRTTMGGVTAVRNAGPALAAVGIAFHDEPAILGALAAILLSGLAAALPIAAVLGRRRAGGAAVRPKRANGGGPGI
jgi:BASS family bile acid:Na+ symporter